MGRRGLWRASTRDYGLVAVHEAWLREWRDCWGVDGVIEWDFVGGMPVQIVTACYDDAWNVMAGRNIRACSFLFDIQTTQ